MKLLYLIGICILIIPLTYGMSSTNYQQTQSVIDSAGGSSTSSNFNLLTSLGQTVSGIITSSNIINYVGFLFGASMNRPPEWITHISNTSIYEDSDWILHVNDLSSPGTGYCLDYDDDPLTFRVVSHNTNEVQCSIIFGIRLDHKPYPDYYGNASCTIGCSDGTTEVFSTYNIEVLNVNDGPVINNVYVLPENPSINNDLRGYCNASDIDNESITYYYKWYLNNNTNSSGYNNNLASENVDFNVANLSSSLTKGNQEWIFSCLATDNIDNSSWQNSSIITVGNTAPNTPILTYPVNGTQIINRTPLFQWTATDPDDDVLTFEFNLTNTVCSDYTNTSVQNKNLTLPFELCTSDETNSNQYFWSVRSYDGQDYSSWSELMNFSIEPSTGIRMINNATSFGTLNLGEETDTTEVGLDPLSFENTGNVKLNISVKSNNQIWMRQALNTEYFQYKVAIDPSKPGSFNTELSQTDWTYLQGSFTEAIKLLDYNTSKNMALLHLLVKVPVDEPPGTKEALIIIDGEQS